MLSGFGTEDTHHILHTLRWGPEGMLYFNQSIYIHSHIETPWASSGWGAAGSGSSGPSRCGSTSSLEGWVNAWGHHFDRWGQSFATDGAGGEGDQLRPPRRLLRDRARAPSGSSPASTPAAPSIAAPRSSAAGTCPRTWRGNILTNDFRANNVRRFVLSDDGSAFASTKQPDLITTRYPAFRPIDIKMGPDGAIYIADWYNPIIQHGEVDFRDPRRDHTRGRIWRVTAKGRPLVAKPKLVGASTNRSSKRLKAPEDWTRHFAKRVLKERGPRSSPPWPPGSKPSTR